jgi:hypothetical protein
MNEGCALSTWSANCCQAPSWVAPLHEMASKSSGVIDSGGGSVRTEPRAPLR